MLRRCKYCDELPIVYSRENVRYPEIADFTIKCDCNMGIADHLESLVNTWNSLNEKPEELPVNEDCLLQEILVKRTGEEWHKAILTGIQDHMWSYLVVLNFANTQSNDSFKCGYKFNSAYRYAKRIEGKVYKKPEFIED